MVALAGKLFADDDQNIYDFAGASVEFIRRFAEDYKAKPQFLVENYRSTRHIVEAANRVIAPNEDRGGDSGKRRPRQVRAVLVWRKSDCAPEYLALCRCETWEVVLPELVFAP